MKRICENCRYWSEMVASFNIDLDALCISGSGPHNAKMTPRWHTCAHFADNALGAVDQPGIDMDTLLEEYARHDGRKKEEK